jgi:hypothetical protein
MSHSKSIFAYFYNTIIVIVISLFQSQNRSHLVAQIVLKNVCKGYEMAKNKNTKNRRQIQGKKPVMGATFVQCFCLSQNPELVE